LASTWLSEKSADPMTTVPPDPVCADPDAGDEAFAPELLELLQPLIAMANAKTEAHAARMRRAMTTAFCVP